MIFSSLQAVGGEVERMRSEGAVADVDDADGQRFNGRARQELIYEGKKRKNKEKETKKRERRIKVRKKKKVT
jgi:hypothetical protein